MPKIRSDVRKLFNFVFGSFRNTVGAILLTVVAGMIVVVFIKEGAADTKRTRYPEISGIQEIRLHSNPKDCFYTYQPYGYTVLVYQVGRYINAMESDVHKFRHKLRAPATSAEVQVWNLYCGQSRQAELRRGP